MNNLLEPISLINEIISDSMVPRNIRQTMQELMSILESEIETPIKCDKAIQLLTIGDDFNIDSFTRTRIWSLLSMLELLTKA